jgi:hypothetical protein
MAVVALILLPVALTGPAHGLWSGRREVRRGVIR